MRPKVLPREELLWTPWALYTGGRSLIELDENPAAAAVLAPSVIPGLRGVGRTVAGTGDALEAAARNTALSGVSAPVTELLRTAGDKIESAYEGIAKRVNRIKGLEARNFAEGLTGVANHGFFSHGFLPRLAGAGVAAALTAGPLMLMKEPTHAASALAQAEDFRRSLDELAHIGGR